MSAGSFTLVSAACVAAWIGSAPLGIAGGEADTMHLTDEPGNWFRSQATGTPVAIIDAGERVDFRINNCCTGTRHTVTLLVEPEGSTLQLDQDSSQNGNISADFDVPGVYVIVCKIHPYMTAVVAVRDDDGSIPDVTAGSLPFIGHLGVDSLPANAVLGVITTIAPTDADKRAKWDILGRSDEVQPSVPGVGEVWIDTQFERVAGQIDVDDVQKPGTITVVDARTFEVEREIDGLGADGMWNNPHNVWANFALDRVYNTNWFGRWLNKIDRETGQILDSIDVGEAPTHVITIPIEGRQFGWLTIPLSAEDGMAKVADGPGGLEKVDEDPTGEGETHPHGHWLLCGTGDRVVVPNVFTGLGVEGSISILDTLSGDVLREFLHDANDPIRSALLMPIAAGECHVEGVHTAYVANAVSGMVTVMNVDAMQLIGNIPVTLTPDGQTGLDILHTLQVPIQTPVSPDERWVATAVLSVTTVDRPPTGAADHIAIIDTRQNQVVAFVPGPAGTHGVNWGAKLGGGYYAYVTSQHANVLTVVDPDPNGDDDGSDAAVVGTILLDNGSPGAGATDGTGGQGVKPLPITHDGWIQRTVDLSSTGALSPEVEGWIALLTDEQKNPTGDHGHVEMYCTCDSGAPCGNVDAGAGCANSTGSGAVLGGTGSTSVSQDDFFLVSRRLPSNVAGLFYMGGARARSPFGDGLRCAGSGQAGLFRYNVRTSGAMGTIREGPIVGTSHARFVPAGHILAGSTWNFQAWYRDQQGPCGSAFNLSNGLAATFVP